MGVKTNGAEYKAYIADTDPKFWPDGSFIDDDVLIVNGTTHGSDDLTLDTSAFKDEDEVIIHCGSFYQSAREDDPISLETHFKRWRKAQSTVRIAVEVHKDKLDGLMTAIKANGGRVT